MWCSTDERIGRNLCQLYSLTKGFENLKLCHLSQWPGGWGVDLCTRQDMLTFFLWCLSSSSSCRNNACLRHNVLGALGTGGFRPWKFYGSADLSYWGDFCKCTFRWHTCRLNPFRTSLVFLKQRERTRVSGTRKLRGHQRARLPSSEPGKQTLANTSPSFHQFTGSVWCY